MILQGPVLHLGGQEQGAVIPLVPVAQGQEQADGGQGRLQVRQDQAVEDPEISRAVNLAGLGNFMGNGLHEVLHQHDQPGAHQQRKQDCEVAVTQVQVLNHQQVEGNQARGEQGREVDIEHNPVPVGEVPPLQGVARHGNNKQADQRTHQRQADGHGVGADHLVRTAEEQFIGKGAEVRRPQGETGPPDAFFCREGRRDDHPERHDTDDTEDGDQDVGQHVDDDLALILADVGRMHQVLGVNLLSHFTHSSFPLRTGRSQDPGASRRRWPPAR